MGSIFSALTFLLAQTEHICLTIHGLRNFAVPQLHHAPAIAIPDIQLASSERGQFIGMSIILELVVLSLNSTLRGIAPSAMRLQRFVANQMT